MKDRERLRARGGQRVTHAQRQRDRKRDRQTNRRRLRDRWTCRQPRQAWRDKHVSVPE